MGLGAGAGVFSIPPCQLVYMSWTMTNAGDTPANYLPSPIWGVLVTTDPSDSSGLTFNINGYYTGSWSGNPGTSASTNIDLESTDKFTINSVNVIGTPVPTGACASASQPGAGQSSCPAGQIPNPAYLVAVAMGESTTAPPCIQLTPPPQCPAGQGLDTKTGMCAPFCSNGLPPAGGVCPGAATTTSPASSAGTYVAVGAAVVGLGAVAWYFLR